MLISELNRIARRLPTTVERIINRFAENFVFQLTVHEASDWRFQSGISTVAGRGGHRYLQYVFAEQGVAMFSSVLESAGAVDVNVVTQEPKTNGDYPINAFRAMCGYKLKA